MLFQTLQLHHSSYSLFRHLQDLYQLQLAPLALLDRLKALYSLLVASDRAPKPPTAWWIVPPAPGGPAPSQATSDSVADDEESQPSLDDDMEEVQFAGAVSTSDPYNYRQPIQADDSDCWKEATLAEYNTLLQNGTWEIVDLPPGEKAIGSSWGVSD